MGRVRRGLVVEEAGEELVLIILEDLDGKMTCTLCISQRNREAGA